MKTRSFKEKVIIITGSSQGIGKATAIQLGQLGANIVLNGRTQAKLQKAQEELNQLGINTLAIQADITQADDCKNLIDRVVSHFGRIDILINNASLTMQEEFRKLEPSVFQSIFSSNASGAAIPTYYALPHLASTNGSVIFISSLAGLHGLPSASAYSMGKAALTQLWQTLRIEMAKTDIHFGIVYVSFTENEPQKRMIISDGTSIEVPQRPKFIQQSREKVAKSIIRMIHRRKKRMVLSPMGKVIAFVFRYFPRTVMSAMIMIERRKKLSSN